MSHFYDELRNIISYFIKNFNKNYKPFISEISIIIMENLDRLQVIICQILINYYRKFLCEILSHLWRLFF